MKTFLFLAFSFLIITLSSCVEIIDDISINADGSGTIKYTVNLSSSKVKINSILALDSLDGKKVPSINEISDRAERIVNHIKSKEGISNVIFEPNYTDYVFKIQFDFKSLEAMQKSLREVIKFESSEKNIPELDQQWISFEQNKLVRSVPQFTVKKASEIKSEDIALLKAGSYTSITRFEEEVVKFDNENGKLSKNGKAVMIRTDAYSLTQNPKLLDNTIYLPKSE